ncbi:MAG: RNA methyltransferase, partial [Bdellovibrionales bacterium]
ASSVSIILVRPQMGENIGAAARAMLNFGFADLRIVSPRDGWPNARAVDTASGAFDQMPPPRVFDDLPGALADLHHVYATTARPRDLVKPVLTPEGVLEDSTSRLENSQRIGIVFGPERTGLENDDLALCNTLVTIPANPDFSSLNLGQCVLLMVSTLGRLAFDQSATPLDHGDSGAVTHDKLEEFLIRLEGELDSAGFFKAQGLKPTMIRNIRAIFTRADLSDQEVRTLHGIVSALIGKKKAAD